MILVGLVLCAIALPLVPQTEAFVLLLAISALLGLGVAIVTPSTTALVADLVRAGRMGSPMGVFGTIWETGEAAGPVLAGFLIGAFSYGWAFATMAFLIGGAAVLFALRVRDPEGRAM